MDKKAKVVWPLSKFLADGTRWQLSRLRFLDPKAYYERERPKDTGWIIYDIAADNGISGFQEMDGLDKRFEIL